MKESPVPFWEKTYENDDIHTFSAVPNSALTEFEHLLSRQSRILEAGCGEGQNVLYLAKHGFHDIDAFDISEAGIAKLKKLCKREGVEINAFTADLASFDFTSEYDLVMSFATLCFVEKIGWHSFISKAKKHTCAGGIHIMHTFTDAVPASPDIAPFAIGLASEGELKELYSDWEILQFSSYTFEDEHPGVPRHLHSVNKLVARKNLH